LKERAKYTFGIKLFAFAISHRLKLQRIPAKPKNDLHFPVTELLETDYDNFI
jgi:hypothetical protein